MSTTYEHATSVAPHPSTAVRPGDSLGDRLWVALHPDEQALRTPHRGLPVPRFAGAVRRTEMYYTVTSIDVWGRLADRSPLLALGWQPGRPVAISVVQDVVVVVSRLNGRNAVTRQGHLRLPASVRHLSRLTAGDRLLVAACPDRDFLVAYPMATVDAMVRAHHSPFASEAPQ